MNLHDYAGATHKGRVRGHNEDSWRALPELGLWIVADGIGGQAAGEVASTLAVERIEACARAGMSIEASIEAANKAILAAPQAGRGRPGMGTTVVALTIKSHHYRVAWLGDSRAYLWNSNGLIQLSHDHSYVQDLLDNGEITSAEAANHPYRDTIMRCLGVTDSQRLVVDTVDGELHPGDRLLLCSDGLTSELTDDAIKAVFDAGFNNLVTADQLVQSALDLGGSDNITVVVVSAPANGEY
jgi:serine/threonine protein phosphatase PrpC